MKMPNKKMDVVVLDCATIAELDFHMNKLACEGWFVSELTPQQDHFFQSFKVVAWRPIKKKKKKVAKK